MSDIRVNAFKDYRVERNPKVAQTIDNTINREWWNAEGWSDMYGQDVEKFKKELPRAKGIGQSDLFVKAGSAMASYKRTKNYQKLEKIFDFIEQKEGYVNPTRADEETEKAMKPGVIYLGELGFGFVRKGLNNTEVPYFFPFPISQRHMEEDGYEALKQGRYITDIKDGGIFVWNDALEAQYKDFEEGGRFVGDEIV